MAYVGPRRAALLGPRWDAYARRWGLVSYWRLDEASGARLDAYGGRHLTDNNTVTQAAGKLGAAGQFTAANSEYLSADDHASLSVGNVDFWLAAWVMIDTTGSLLAVAGKGSNANNRTLYEWQVVYDGASSQRFRMTMGDSTNAATLSVTALPVLSAATWYFVLAWHDSAGDTINVRTDHGTPGSTATGGLFPNDTADALLIGARPVNGSPADFMNGRIDAVAFGKSPPGGIAGVIDEISARLYSNGNGRAFPWVG